MKENITGCAFCDEFENGSFPFEATGLESRIVLETQDFIVFPAVGQIVEGYLLIAPKKHYVSAGGLPGRLLPELESVCKRVKGALSRHYAAPLFFEHGSISEHEKCGNCISHAHIHAVPGEADMLAELAKHFRYERILGFHDLKERFESALPYLFYESTVGERFMFYVESAIPSQYLRRVFAAKSGRASKWDWRQHPGYEEMRRTIIRLAGKI